MKLICFFVSVFGSFNFSCLFVVHFGDCPTFHLHNNTICHVLHFQPMFANLLLLFLSWLESFLNTFCAFFECFCSGDDVSFTNVFLMCHHLCQFSFHVHFKTKHSVFFLQYSDSNLWHVCKTKRQRNTNCETNTYTNNNSDNNNHKIEIHFIGIFTFSHSTSCRTYLWVNEIKWLAIFCCCCCHHCWCDFFSSYFF